MLDLSPIAVSIPTEGWSFLFGLLSLLITSSTVVYVARLRHDVQLRRDETDRLCRMAEQANRTYELSLQDRTANLPGLLLEIARLDSEVRKADRAHEEKAGAADETRPASQAA